jgi:hypothetical protein
MGSTSPTFDTSTTNSIIFDGLTQYIEVPTISFIPLNGFSFVATIKLSSSISIGSTLFVIGNDLAMTNYLAIVYSAVNTLAFRICVSSIIYDITQTVSLNTQYHIVFTFNPPNTITIYINNVSVNNTTTIILPSQNTYTYNSIGCTFTSGGIPTGNAAFTCYNYNFYPRGFSANDVSTNYAINSIIGINSSLPLQNQPIPTGTLMDLSLTQNEIINISSVTPSMTTTGATITFAGNYVTASIGYSTLSLTNQTSPVSITSLTPNTSYTFTVIPYNSSGLTNNYGILSAIGVTLGIVGGQSISLGSSATSLTASWGANNTGGYYYTSVSVAWSPSTAGSPTIVSNSQTSYTPTNLTANTSYTFTLTPLNSVTATGTPVVTSALYTYGSVTGVAAGTYLANGTGFRVSWTTSATWTTINITGTAGTFSAISASFKDFTALSPNTSYTVNVYPVNFQSAQNNNGIQTVTPVTYATVTGLSVGTYLSNGTGFTVSWSASGTSGTSWFQINISGCGTYNNISGTSQAVTGLTANTSYTVALSPLNTAAAVNTSYQTTTVVTLATISSSTGSSSNVTTASCTITWASGTYTNVTISVSPSVSGFPTTQTGTSYNVTGLTSSTVYVFTITPNNSASVGNTGNQATINVTTTSSSSPAVELTVPVPFFNGFRFMLQDYSSGYYVCADGSSKFLCSSGSTLANATIFQVYNNSAVYNNSSGGVALQTYMGQYSDGGYMRHAGYTCYSNGFGSGNFDFAWLFQTTGTQNVFTIYNWYGGNYYLDIVNNYLQINNSTPRQWKVTPYDYNAISASGLFTNAYNLYQWYIASQSVSGNTWTDLSGNSRTGSGSGTITATTDAVSANGNTNAIPYVYGGTSATVTFGGTVPNPYTLMTVTRYSSTTGTTYRRIINTYNSGSENALQGHWSGYAGVIYHNAWCFPTGSAPSSTYISPNTNWVFTACTSSASRLIVQGSSQNSGLVAGSTGTSTGTGSFNINVYVGENSDWAFAELGTWNRELNAYEMSLINSYIYRRYGIGAAPAMNIGSVGYLVFSHKIVLNSGVFFANSTEAANTGTLSVVTSSAQHKYSILSQIGNFRRSDGTYEFIFYVCTDDTNFTTMPYRRWTQTSNPYTTSGVATGYTPITQGWTFTDTIGGLRQSGASGTTLFDIEGTSTGNFWGAVGMYAGFGGGFPEDQNIRTFIQLWMV